MADSCSVTIISLTFCGWVSRRKQSWPPSHQQLPAQRSRLAPVRRNLVRRPLAVVDALWMTWLMSQWLPHLKLSRELTFHISLFQLYFYLQSIFFFMIEWSPVLRPQQLRFTNRECWLALFIHQPRLNLRNKSITTMWTPIITTCAWRDSLSWRHLPLWRLPVTRSSHPLSLNVLRWFLAMLASVAYQLASPSANDKHLTLKSKPTQFFNDDDPIALFKRSRLHANDLFTCYSPVVEQYTSLAAWYNDICLYNPWK